MLDFFFGILIEIGYCHVETVVAKGIVIASSLPFLKCRLQTFTLCLQNKINYGCCPAIQSGTRSGFVIVAAVRSHKRHVEMHVRINSAWQNEFPRSVDFGIRCYI